MKNIFLFILVILCISCNDSKKQQAEKETISDEVVNSLPESMARGGQIYTDYCMQCHLGNGLGVPKNFPPLANSNWLTEKREESIHAVKYGQNGEIEVNGVPYNGVMVAMGLSDQEVADVLNYVMNNWDNTQDKMVTAEEVNSVSK